MATGVDEDRSGGEACRELGVPSTHGGLGHTEDVTWSRVLNSAALNSGAYLTYSEHR